MTDDPGENATAPNCERCLLPTEIEGEGAAARWRCPDCHLVIVA